MKAFSNSRIPKAIYHLCKSLNLSKRIVYIAHRNECSCSSSCSSFANEKVWRIEKRCITHRKRLQKKTKLHLVFPRDMSFALRTSCNRPCRYKMSPCAQYSSAVCGLAFRTAQKSSATSFEQLSCLKLTPRRYRIIMRSIDSLSVNREHQFLFPFYSPPCLGRLVLFRTCSD